MLSKKALLSTMSTMPAPVWLDEHPWLQVALPVPVRRFFDYRMPKVPVRRGQRVRVPFGRRELIGIAVSSSERSAIAEARILPVKAVLAEGTVSGDLMDLLLWAAHYYQHPPGEALTLALPPVFRKTGDKNKRRYEWRAQHFRLTAQAAPDQVKRYARQYAVLQALANAETISAVDLNVPQAVLAALQAKGWIEVAPCTKPSLPPAPVLSDEQAVAAKTIVAALGRYQCFLLEGVTGSGKTEVYMAAVAHCLQVGLQVLILVPEIGLASEMQRRLQLRFPDRLAVIHSGLAKNQRRDQWLAASQGTADILLGTRAALLTPMPELGLIVVDEEHDNAYKQSSGFCYSARDLAVKRAVDRTIPVVLGSATPSLESLMNVEQGLYRSLQLKQRARNLKLPCVQLVDLRSVPRRQLFSETTLALMRTHLDRGDQVLVFVNRRGLAPVLFCRDCHRTFDCSHCDARLVLHIGQAVRFALCHHCGRKQPVPEQCPACHRQGLVELGAGTQRFEDVLKTRFADDEVLRFDTDVSAVQRFQMLQSAQNGRRQILVGTQMLAKGYDFPNLTLTVIADVDVGFFAVDFRSVEKMSQLIVQVSGRAGRHQPGQVLIQTRYPKHPALKALLESGYRHFAGQMLTERHATRLPPYTYLALFRSEAKTAQQAQAQLVSAAETARCTARRHNLAHLEVWGPSPMLLKRKAGLFRRQLVLCAGSRADLKKVMVEVIAQLESSRHKAAWFVEVDPLEVG